MLVYVCNLEEMPEHVRRLRPGHLVSLVAPDEQPPRPAGLPAERHLRIEIDDINEPWEGLLLPEREHVQAVLDLALAWDAREPLLFHCVAGISRSMAAALISVSARAPGREEEIALGLRRLAPHAHPNRRIIALADELLGRGGRLVAAREAMGESVPMLQGPLVRIPLL